MKKNKKIMKFAVLGIALSTLSLAGVSASTAGFSTKLPAFNGKKTTTAEAKDTNDQYGSVTLSVLENEEVTFRIGPSDGKNYGPGITISQDYLNVAMPVKYKYIYGAGQMVNAQYNNHNWTNHQGRIIGVVDYK